MIIPKCKECEYLKIDQSKAHKEHPSIFCKGYYCTHLKPDKPVKASEAKTSPKWCPKRQAQ